MPSRLHRLALALSGPLSLLLIVTGFFWKIVLTSQFSWLEQPDLADQVAPWLNYQAKQFHAHTFPSWDPYLFGGQSLIGQGQPGAAYPLNWLLFSLPLHAGHISFDALNWYYLLIHYLAALFCYLLCRDLGRGRMASVLAGVGFGLGGYVGISNWPQMINGAIWAPLVFLFLFRVARGVRPAASAGFCGLFLGMSWLAGHHQVPVFLSLAAAGVWLYFLFERRRLERRLLIPSLLFIVFFLATSALQTWPAYEYGHMALRWAGSQHDPLAWNEPVPYTVHEQYSLNPIHLLGIFVPGYWTTVSPFIGVVGLAIAGLGVACCWKLKEVRILCAVGIAGLFLALGKNDVFHGILYSLIPLVEKARSPGVAVFLFQFAASVLLAFGLDAMFLASMRMLVRRSSLIVAGFGAVVLFIILGVDLSRNLNWGFDDRVAMCPLIAFALAALIYRSSRVNAGVAGISVLIIGLYMVELGNEAFYWLPRKDDPNLGAYLKSFDSTRAVADFLRRQPGPIRVDVARDAVEFNFGDWYGIDTFSGILPSLPAALYNLGFTSNQVKLLYGTNYSVARKPVAGLQEVFRDNSGLIVYKNPDSMPRIWIVHEALQVRNPEDTRRQIQGAAFDARKETFSYEAPPPLDRCEGDTVRSFERTANTTTAVVDMKCRGIVIESENDAPGWAATIDGRPAPVYTAYTSMRGVVAGAGLHRIEMRYRPGSVIGGAILTLAAFLGALMLLLVPRLQRDT